MKNLALDLDSGNLSRWVGDLQPFTGWSDNYGDVYALRLQLYCSSGQSVPPASIQLLVKRPGRRDAAALWSLAAFSRGPAFISRSAAVYVGTVDVSGEAYRQALRIDASRGNDLPVATFLASLRVIAGTRDVQSSFEYNVYNTSFREVDSPDSGN